MTSPDFQTPAGALSPAAMNWLQDMLAKPIGQEGKQILQALASIGDSMLSRFFKGYTDIADVFSHAFDELGAELGGIPGMSGVQAWVDDIEGLLTNALDLIDNVFTGVTDIVDGLAFAVTGQGVEGNIAEGMHLVVQGLTTFLELANTVMDLITELIDGVLGVTGGTMHQLVQVLSWVIGVANQFLLFFNGIYDVFGDLLDFAPGGERPLAALLAGLPNLLSVFSNLDAGNLIGEIPSALLAGVQDAIDDVGQFVQNFMDAVLRAIRGVPVVGGTLADIIAEIGGLQQKAVDAQSNAAAAQTTATSVQSDLGSVVEGIWNGWFGSGGSGQAAEAQQTIAAIKDAVLNGYTVQTITSSQTWTKPSGTLTEIVVAGVGSGKNGAAGVRSSAPGGGAGGLNGGYLVQAFDPASVPATVAVTIGTNGNPTSFGSLLTTTPGSGGIATQFGFSSTSSTPGSGGRGSDFSSTATGGGSTPLAAGGTPGATSTGSGSNGGAGGTVSAGTSTKCGGGGGGGGGAGGTFNNSIGSGGKGGDGGYPGGGGGGGGQGNGIAGSNTSGAGGTGANGVLWVFYR